MTKAPISLQGLRRSLYVKAKAEPSWRFWGLYVHVCKMETLHEMLCLSIAVVQSPFTSLACLGIDIRYLLNAWVIIHSYDDHVRLLLPNLRSSMLQSLTGPQ